MITFQEFMSLCEAYDASVMSSSQVRRTGAGGRIGAERRKTAPEKRRVKAVGGGQTAPAKPYKPRKDIGVQRPRSTREQQPTKERGTAALSPKEAQRKAYLERKARERGETQATSASQLLAKKKKETVSPDYKPAKKSGLSRQERLKVTRQGEAKLRDLVIAAEKSKGKKVSSEKDLKHRYTSR
jgi:hypothetical protein